MAEPIRVLLVDDHVVVREGLSILIDKNDDMQVVAVAGTGEEAIVEFRRHRPNITLMDLRLPKLTGFEAIRTIRGIDPLARLIVLTMYRGDADIQRALKAGACAYLFKNSLADQLISTIRSIHHAPVATITNTATMYRTSDLQLSPREVEVIELFAEGLRDKEIGGRLGITEATVGVHAKHIFEKLHVHDRTAALAAALKLGIIHIE